MSCIENAKKEMIELAKQSFINNATNITLNGNIATLKQTNFKGKKLSSLIGQANSSLNRMRKVLGDKYGTNLTKSWGKLNSYNDNVSVDLSIPPVMQKALQVKYEGKNLVEANNELQESYPTQIGENQYEFEGEIYPTEEMYQVDGSDDYAVRYSLKVVDSLFNLAKPKETRRSKKYNEKTEPERLTIKLNSKESPNIETNIRKSLNGKGVPNNQIDFIFDYMRSAGINSISTEELAIELASKYGYKVEVKTAKVPLGSIDEGFERIDGGLEGENTKTYDYLSARNFENKSKYKKEDGWVYAELDIVTPLIHPFIESHAGFANKKNSIGWARVWYNKKTGAVEIQEIQSDLFQRGRDKKDLVDFTTTEPATEQEFKNAELNGKVIYSGRDGGKVVEYNNVTYNREIHVDYGDGGSWASYNKVSLEKKIELNNNNQFLQLLNKNNNWVTFFIKTIIQDSAKRGYERVLFPKGETAAKIEGHQTIADDIKKIDDEIQTIKNYKNPKGKIILENYSEDGRNVEEFDNAEDAANFQFNNSGWDVVGLEYNEKLASTDKLKSLEQRKANLGSQGIEKFKPIEAFYEIRVGNILEKQFGKNNIKTITDEYGNQWRELTIDKQRDLNNILLQKKATKSRDRELDARLTEFANNLDIDIRDNLKNIKDKSGNTIDVVAKADLLNKVIEINDGKAGLDTLTEEVVHFATSMLKDKKVIQELQEDIVNHEIYSKVVEEYSELYKGDETKLRKEAVDKLITEELIKLHDDSKFTLSNITSKFLELLKKIFNITTSKQYREEVNPYSSIAQSILDQGLSRFDVESDTVEEFYQARNSSKSMEPLTQKDVIDKLNEISATIDKSDRKYFNNITNKQIQRTVDDMIKDASRKLGFKNTNTLAMLKGATVSMYNGFILDNIINNKTPNHSEALEYVNKLTKDNYAFNSELNKLETGLSSTEFIALSSDNFKELVDGMDIIVKDIKENQRQLDSKGEVVLKSQQTVYNQTNDTAGTIDLLAIYSDGSMGIYDFSTSKESTDSFGKITSLSNNKRDVATVKITAGLSNIITESIGNVQFRQLRLVPINVQYYTGKYSRGFKKIEIATKENNSEYLDHIPLEGEITGYSTLDKLVDKIHKQKVEISNSKLDKLQKNQKLKNLNDVLQVLLYKKDVVLFGKKVRYLNEIILSKIGNPQHIPNHISTEELKSYKHHIDNFEDIDLLYDDLVKLNSKNAKDEYRKALNFHAGEFRKLKNAITVELNSRAMNVTGVDLTQPHTSINMFSALFGGLQSFDNPVFKAIGSLFRKAEERTRVETRDFHKNLKDVTDKLKEYSKSSGKSLSDTFNMFIKDKQFIQKIDKVKFNSARENAINSKDLKWFKENTSFREVEYNKKSLEYWEYLNNPITSHILNDTTLSEDEKTESIANQFEEWESKYNVIKYPNAYYNSKNTYYLIPNTKVDNYNTKEYDTVNSNVDLRHFYDLYSDFMTEAIDIVGSDKLKGNFIPNYSRNMIEQFGEKGLSGFTNLTKNFKQSFVVQENDAVRGVVDAAGNQILTIPIYGISSLYQEPSNLDIEAIELEVEEEFTKGTSEYLNEVDRRKKVLGYELGDQLKSLDLSKSLLLFSEQIYNYKNLADIETTVMTYKEAIDSNNVEFLLTDVFGRNLKKWQTNLLQKTFNVPASTQDLVDKVVRRELYGQQIQGTRGTFNVKGVTYDWAKVFQTASNYMTIKSLALNPVLGISNYVGARVNLNAHFREGLHFTKTNFNEGIKSLINSDPKVKAMIGFFEPSSRNLTYERATNLSASKLVKSLTLDHLMSFHKYGDDNIDKGILLGMSKHYVVDSDGSIKNPKTDKLIDKNSPSVYESINIENDKLIINGLKKNTSEQEYANFRAKVLRVSYLTKGSMGKEQEMLGNTSIMFRALMKFRGWMPGLITARFNKLKYDTTLEMYNEGRLRAVWGDVVGGKAVHSLKSFSQLLAEVAAFGFYNKEINEQALKIKYDKFITENAETKFTYEEFKAWYKPLLEAKLRGTAFELRALLVLIGITVAAGMANWDDDEENGLFTLYTYNIIRRSTLELSFFYDKGSVDEIVKSPTAMWSLTGDLINIFTNAVDETISPGEDKTPIGYYTLKSIPIQNQIMNAFDYWDKN